MKLSTLQFSEINSNNLNYLHKAFKELDGLNKILKSILPLYLHNTCHIGAIDEDSEIVVLFVSNQQSFHLIRNFNEAILNALIKSNFNFQKILIRISDPRPENSIIYRGELDSRRKEKLLKLATEIGKPEMVLSVKKNTQKDSNEIVI